jgi:DNA-binding GntR family transcriptional regulator
MRQSSLKLPTANRVRDVTASLEEEILLGWLLPRQRLVEDELMERLGVKRHVVREALAELERAGIVERIPNRGAVVRLLDPVEVMQIYSVREALESLAAEQISLPVDPELLTQLEAIQANHSKAISNDDPRAALRANMRFHETLFGACGNPHLVEQIQTMAQKVHVARSMTGARPEYLIKAREEHLAMLDALRDDNRAELVELCRKHLEPCRDAYIAIVQARLTRSIEIPNDGSRPKEALPKISSISSQNRKR